MVRYMKRLLGDLCSVYVLEKEENKTTGRTESKEKMIFEDILCHFISKGGSSYVKDNIVPKVSHTGILIVEKNIQIPMGSKIQITQNGFTQDYAYAGVPTVYSSHREIPVALFERWI